VVGCGVLVRRVTEEEVAERVKQALAKRASAWKRATSGPDAEILSLGGMVKKAEKAAAEAEGEETKAETPSEPDDSPQERLHFLLELEEHKRKSLVCSSIPLPIFHQSKHHSLWCWCVVCVLCVV
jgi:hypothetical protein